MPHHSPPPRRAPRRAPAHGYPRMVRVNSLLQRVLAEELTRLADEDERLRLLTCTVVLCEPDLRHATVMFATLGADAAEALADHRRELQATIAAEVRLKRIPALTFAADPAVEAGERVEEALRRLHRPDAPPAP